MKTIIIITIISLLCGAAMETAQAQWQLQTTLSGNPPLVSVKTVSRDVAWVCNFNGIVYRTTNGGQNWIPTTDATNTEAIACIEALDSTTAFVGGGGPGWGGGNVKIYRTTNGGQSWEVVYTAPAGSSFWNWIHFFDAQNGIAQSDPPTPGGNFLIVKTSDAGTTWTPIANPPDANTNEYGVFNGFYFYDNLNGWFGTGHPPFVPGGNAGRVFRTTNGGNTWTAFASGNGESVNAVRFISPMVGIRTSDSPPFLARSLNGGITWAEVSNLPVANIQVLIAATGVVTASMNQLWVYGEASAPFILTSIDGGATWQEQAIAGTVQNSICHLSAVSFGASSDSVQAFGITFNIATLGSGGQIFNYRNPLGLITGIEEQTTVPIEYELSQNYPNPFNPSTTIRFSLAKATWVKLTVYNTLGQQIAVLADDNFKTGNHEVVWNPAGLPGGVFYYRLETGSFVETRKMILLK